MHSLTSDITGGLMLKVSEGTKHDFFFFFFCILSATLILNRYEQSFRGFFCISHSPAPTYVMHSMTARCPNHPHAKQINFCYLMA